jgi:hypothetical protein
VINVDRLRSIVRGGAPRQARELTYEPEVEGWRTPPPDPARLADQLGGTPLETAAGPCLAIDRRFDASRLYGPECVENYAAAEGPLLSRLAGAPAQAAEGEPRFPAPLLFVDLETTGLSGGAGTVAFLVGCGWFEDGAFRTRQFFLMSFAAERALLVSAGAAIADAGTLVSFNGRTFDLPVLETRWLFHRLQPPFDGKPHLDVLHPARRLWKRRRGTFDGAAGDGACTLTALERELLGITRKSDVGGFEIPSRYFQYLRRGDPTPLEPVLDHNRRDLLSLAAVMALACRLVDRGADAARDGFELLALGRLFERTDSDDRAVDCYRRAAADADPVVRAAALHRLAMRMRRARRHADAAGLWQALLSEAPDARVAAEANRALAVHHEHRVRDFRAARRFAAHALDALDRRIDARRRREAEHRLARLERKLNEQVERRIPGWPAD